MFYTQSVKKHIALRIVAFALVLLLTLSVMFAAAPRAQASPDDGIVRVRLSSYGSKSSFKFTVVGTYQVEGYPELLFCDGETFTVKASSSNIVLCDASGKEYTLPASVNLLQRQSGKTNLLCVDAGYYYAGDMNVAVSGSSIVLTNYVYIETYLQGVLPYEMSNSFPMEALMAQAVAARTYVYSKMLSRASSAYDVVDTTSDQVYRGYDYKVTYSNCRNAISLTVGQVMLTGSGTPINAYYTASNGGMTEDANASGVSSSSADYLLSKADSADLAVSLASGSAYSAKLYIPKQIDGGVLATSSTTSYKMLRTQMQAQGIVVENIASVTVQSITLHTPRNASYPDRAFTGADIVVSITYKDATTDVQTLTFAGIKSGNVNLPFLNDVIGTSLSFRMLYLEEQADEFLLASVRYGHGTGMSQMGAKYRAQQGETYRQILGFYYECDNGGCTLSTKAWSAPSVSSAVMPTLSANAAIVGTNVNFRAGAGTGYDVIGTLSNGQRVHVLYKNGDWCKVFADGKMGFVSASYVQADAVQGESGSGSTGSGSSAGSTTPSVTTGKVTASSLYVRSGPAQSYASIGSVRKGETVTIVGSQNGWYEIQYGSGTGYVSGEYISDVKATGGSSSDNTTTSGSTTSTTTGTVTASLLNIRSGAGTGYSQVGSILRGETVTILEKTSNGWYRITYKGTTGYVSGDYISNVTTTGGSSGSTPSGSTSSGNTGSSSSSGGSSSGSTSIAMTGTISATSLYVRSGAGTSYSKLGSLTRGTKVTLFEKTSNGWYRINYNGNIGYISGDYVTNVTTTGGTSSESTSSGGSAGSTSTSTTGTVTASSLYVRSGAGTSYSKLGSLARGSKVTITASTDGWYQINYNGKTGYVSAQYISVSTSSDSSSSSTDANTMATVTASSLYVRKGPSQNYAILGGLVNGQRVTVTKTENGWCQIKFGSGTGYVSADYLRF